MGSYRIRRRWPAAKKISSEESLQPGGTGERGNTGKWRREAWGFYGLDVEAKKEGDHRHLVRRRDLRRGEKLGRGRRKADVGVTSAVGADWRVPPVSGCGKIKTGARLAGLCGLLVGLVLARACREKRWAGPGKLRGRPFFYFFLTETFPSLFQNHKT